MKNETILYEQRGQVAFVTLNRPHRGNSYDKAFEIEFNEVWDEVRTNNDIRGIIVTGAGDRHFCTGIDQKAAAASDAFHSKGSNPSQFPDRPKGLWKPYIAAINGVVAGAGIHFLWQTDFAIAADHATFLDPHVTRGWVPIREMLGLATRAPFGPTMRMALMGNTERMSAQRAYEIGLVTEVVPKENLIPRAFEIMEKILEQAPLAVQAIIESMHRAYGLEYRHLSAVEHGELIRVPVQTSEDRREGSRAFAEGRKPVWKGR
jgi:E-phenylitaconyl-CoA hydratase